MGIIGVSLLLASVVCLCVFPRPWLRYLRGLRRLPPPPPRTEKDGPTTGGGSIAAREGGDASAEKAARDRAAMPPPPPIIRLQQQQQQPERKESRPEEKEEDSGQTTPKAEPATTHADDVAAVPTFSLDEPEQPPVFPAPFSAQRAGGGSSSGSSGSGSMRPPAALPPRLAPSSNNSSTRTLSPLPNRGPPSSLAPPPTQTSKPAKPSRKVELMPGHSPLDWARLSSGGADLRNLPPQTPYLRVPPSGLRRMTGRRGRNAWTALGGKVYNITPYLAFHPGGEPELLRCAGRDGNKLFGEIHPWVNYDTMLAACLVGILVDEPDSSSVGGGGGSAMEEMD